MDLLKLIKNRITTEWKETFNTNVDILNRKARDQDQKLETTNSRIDNLVLHSGGDSPNEVVDARVNNKAVRFDTLAARLLDTENMHDSDVEQLNLTQSDQQKQLEQLNNSVGKIVGSLGGTINIYISGSTGNDRIGDGTQTNPFKTIQMAVNTIPFLSTSVITFFVDSGTYLEDVIIRNINFISFELRPIESVDTLDPSTNDLPVKVRSLSFAACRGYCRVSGIQIVDTANAPNYGINSEQSGYTVINRCKFAENTKSLANSYAAIRVNGTSQANVYGNTAFINQRVAVLSTLMGETLLSSFAGSGNSVGALADSGTVRGSVNASFATTPTRAENFGLIITKGTVLS